MAEQKNTPPADKSRPQKIVVFQQDGRGEAKVAGVRLFGGAAFEIEVVSVPGGLPPLLDDTSAYLPEEVAADLVLDFLKHPDLSQDLAAMCERRGIPVIASGRKIAGGWAASPHTCCGLVRQDGLGAYARMFGRPELKVVLENGRVAAVEVIRGAPCGSTWDAAEEIIGLPAREAAVRYGLETQYCCTADPAAWDPLFEKSPVHFAADVHRAALEKALKAWEESSAEK